jgi:hypothetical protein
MAIAVENLTHAANTRRNRLQNWRTPAPTFPHPPASALRGSALKAVRDALAAYATAKATYDEALDTALDFPSFAELDGEHLAAVLAAERAGETVAAAAPDPHTHAVRFSHAVTVAEKTHRELRTAAEAVDTAVLTAREPVRAALLKEAQEATAAAGETFRTARAAYNRAGAHLETLRSLDHAALLAEAGDGFEPRNTAAGIAARLEQDLRDGFYDVHGKRYAVMAAWDRAERAANYLTAAADVRAVDPLTRPEVTAAIREAQERTAATERYYREHDERRAARTAERQAEAEREAARVV